jgi:hypothetical protein
MKGNTRSFTSETSPSANFALLNDFYKETTSWSSQEISVLESETLTRKIFSARIVVAIGISRNAVINRVIVKGQGWKHLSYRVIRLKSSHGVANHAV